MAFSIIGRFKESLPLEPELFHEGFISSINEWQEKVKNFIGGKLGYADVGINHFFHGFREDRQYVMRMKILIEMKFNPKTDLEYNEQGVFQLKEHRKDIKAAITKYFADRKEDAVTNKLELKSTKLPINTVDKLIKSALNVKSLLELEKFKIIAKAISESRQRAPWYYNRPSRSVDGRSENPPQRRTKKTVEMFYEMNLNCSDSKGSTDNSQIGDSDNELNPSFRNPYQFIDDTNLVTKFGQCCSKTSKGKSSSEAASSQPQQSQNNNQNIQYYNQNNLNNNNNNQNWTPEEAKGQDPNTNNNQRYPQNDEVSRKKIEDEALRKKKLDEERRKREMEEKMKKTQTSSTNTRPSNQTKSSSNYNQNNTKFRNINNNGVYIPDDDFGGGNNNDVAVQQHQHHHDNNNNHEHHHHQDNNNQANHHDNNYFVNNYY
jgi:hypothetical protein